jgi:hypothetical protein
MYTTKFLNVGTKKKPTMNLIVPQRQQSNMLDLHSTNKENLPLELPSNNKKPTIQFSQASATCKKGMWTYDALETTIGAIKRRTHSLKKASRSWNIPLSTLSSHLNGKTKSRNMGPRGVLALEEDVEVIKWTLIMQECRLSKTYSSQIYIAKPINDQGSEDNTTNDEVDQNQD